MRFSRLLIPFATLLSLARSDNVAPGLVACQAAKNRKRHQRPTSRALGFPAILAVIR